MVPEQGQRPVYASAGWEIDLARRELRSQGVPVPLGGRAFEIVAELVQSGGELVSKTDLAERVWPSMAEYSPKTAPALMSRKIASRPEIDRIITRATPLTRKNTSVLSSW